MRGVFLDVDTVVHGDDINLQVLRETLPDWQFYATTSTAQVVERMAEADVIVSNKVVLNEVDIKRARKLKLIVVAATGTNNVDLSAARDRGVAVSNVRDYATPSVVEHTFALILALARQLPAYRTAVEAQAWSRASHFAMLDYPIFELHGKTLGIIGFGVLGQAVARVGEAFGMHVIVMQSLTGKNYPNRYALDDLLRNSDIVSLHCPLTNETRGLIGEAQLARMKNHALLINTARGGIVDEAALFAALKNGVIAGAGIDVLTQEPPRANHVLLQESLPNLIVTPHIAWASREARQRLVNDIALNVQAFLSGQMRNSVLS